MTTILPPMPTLEEHAPVRIDEDDHCAPAWMLEDEDEATRTTTWRPPTSQRKST